MIGWKISDECKLFLLNLFPAQFDDVIADHITFGSGVDYKINLPYLESAYIVGVSSDNLGVQAMIVTVNGDIYRPDGRIFHATWSLDRSSGRRPSDSNDVISNFGWSSIARPINIQQLIPARF